jgi:hypothetical protein
MYAQLLNLLKIYKVVHSCTSINRNSLLRWVLLLNHFKIMSLPSTMGQNKYLEKPVTLSQVITHDAWKVWNRWDMLPCRWIERNGSTEWVRLLAPPTSHFGSWRHKHTMLNPVAFLTLGRELQTVVLLSFPMCCAKSAQTWLSGRESAWCVWVNI